MEKILGTENPADLMTKRLDQKTLDKLLNKMSIRGEEGRANIAPTLNKKTEAVASLEESAPNAWLDAVQSMGRHAKWADQEDDEEAHVDIASFEEISKQDFGMSYKILGNAPGHGERTKKGNSVGTR